MKLLIPTPLKFSEYFGLEKSQSELNFLDIYAHQDIPLFLDPYGISAMNSQWSRDCENQITTYFQYLVDSIKTGDKKSIRNLLSALHEVNEVALGYSKIATAGRGIGPKQAKEIQEAFENSAAAQSGDIKDIADCALLIPGINRDKISDITTNILKKQLIDFTKHECEKHGIPLKKVAIHAFNHETFKFDSYYDYLPVIEDKPKILLPVNSVRRDPELSKDKYYRNFVIEYLRAEHTHAGDALASVLKNGQVVVRISDLKAKYPMDVEFLYNFSKEHPQVLEKYKTELRRTANKANERPALNPNRKILNAQERMSILNDIKVGSAEATNFHKIAYDNLIYIFGERLSNPDSEVIINEGRKRIDIVFDNNDNKGFFKKLYSLHNIQCPKILVECKNYGVDVSNPEIDQLLGRFSDKRGKFGILVCRAINNKANLIKRCKDVMHDHAGYIIVLDDMEISELLNYKEIGKEVEIDNFMGRKLDELIM